MKRTLLVLGLLLVASLCLAQIPSGPDWVTFERTTPTTGTVRWSAEPSLYVDLYYICLASTDRIYNPPFTGSEEPPWNSGLLPGYDGPLGNWIESPGVYKFDHPLVLDPAKDYIAYVAANNLSWQWNASSSLHNPYMPTLPVELSSFNAVLAAETLVDLQWITQSETSNLGFNIYRSNESNILTARKLNIDLIAGTNTSSSHSYHFEDHEIDTGITSYYYWLEIVNFDGSSSFSNVVSVNTGSDLPVIPSTTNMKSAYPNPFHANASTKVEIDVKTGENATLSVYNILGQKVKTFTRTEGSYTITWDGRDEQGSTCGSGIYFYRFDSPSTTITKKMMIVK